MLFYIFCVYFYWRYEFFIIDNLARIVIPLHIDGNNLRNTYVFFHCFVLNVLAGKLAWGNTFRRFLHVDRHASLVKTVGTLYFWQPYGFLTARHSLFSFATICFSIKNVHFLNRYTLTACLCCCCYLKWCNQVREQHIFVNWTNASYLLVLNNSCTYVYCLHPWAQINSIVQIAFVI